MTRTLTITPGDQRHWQGALAWERQGQWWQPWRLLPDLVATAHSDDLAVRARMPAGVRCRMITDASAMTMPIESGADGVSMVDVVVDDNLAHRVRLEAGSSAARFDLPGHTSTVDVWLPQSVECRIGTIDAIGATSIDPVPGHGFSWVAYGSSITHCRGRAGPSEIWPALVARSMDWRLTSLGLGGQCHLDAVAARSIVATPADLISLCLGINIYGAATFSPRSLVSQICGFVQVIRDQHSNTPILIISPLCSPTREACQNAVGMTLADIRSAVATAARLLRERGDHAIHYHDGLELIGVEDADLLADGLHPHEGAYPLLARRMSGALNRALGEGRQQPTIESGAR